MAKTKTHIQSERPGINIYNLFLRQRITIPNIQFLKINKKDNNLIEKWATKDEQFIEM